MGRDNSETFEEIPLSTVTKEGFKHVHDWLLSSPTAACPPLPEAPGVKEVTPSTSRSYFLTDGEDVGLQNSLPFFSGA